MFTLANQVIQNQLMSHTLLNTSSHVTTNQPNYTLPNQFANNQQLITSTNQVTSSPQINLLTHQVMNNPYMINYSNQVINPEIQPQLYTLINVDTSNQLHHHIYSPMNLQIPTLTNQVTNHPQIQVCNQHTQISNPYPNTFSNQVTNSQISTITNIPHTHSTISSPIRTDNASPEEDPNFQSYLRSPSYYSNNIGVISDIPVYTSPSIYMASHLTSNENYELSEVLSNN